jgi:hypothetical protein
MPEKGKPGLFEMQFRLDTMTGPLTDLIADKTGEQIGKKKKDENQAPGSDSGNLQDSNQYTRNSRSHNAKVFYFIKKLPHLYYLKVWYYGLLTPDLFPLQISFSLSRFEHTLNVKSIFSVSSKRLYVIYTT